LRHRYEADARARLTGNQFKALHGVAQATRGTFLVKEAASIWKNERSRAARLITELQRAGYVAPLERLTAEERGRYATVYGLTGSAVLAFSGEERRR
jgi:DNA-binding MarR family transcriptional regulator